MINVAGRRVLSVLPILLALAAAVFVLQRVSPIDPARAVAGAQASPAAVAAARIRLGLDRPLWEQYLRYVAGVSHGDLGQSAITRRPVSTDLRTFLPATIELIAVAVVIAVAAGLLLGILSARRSRGSGVLRVFMVGASSVPVFLAALLAILFFYGKLGWLPATGQTSIRGAPTGPTGFLLLDGLLAGRTDVVLDGLQHVILPAMCLAIIPAVAIGRVLASSLQFALRSDQVRTARAKGLTERGVLLHHGLRNAAGPALSIAGLQVAGLFGSVIVIESIFAWPGVGLYTAQAINRGDFTTIAGVTLALGVIYLVTNLIVDLCQAWADPRLRS